MKKRTFRITASWAAVAVCMGIIFSLSAQNGAESSDTSSWLLLLMKLPISESALRTAAHFLEFTGLAVLVYNALYQTCSKTKPFLSFAIASAYAVMDELHQLFVEERACSLFDWFIDSLGAASGVAVLCLVAYILRRRKLRDRK